MSGAEADRKIWWLASYPKSGSTWVRLCINAYVTGFPVDINTAFQFTMSDLDARIIQACSVKSITRMSFAELVYLRPAILLNIINFGVTRDTCVKTHNAKVALDDIKLIPPKLSRGVIYLVRDPRDVVISAADHMGQTIDETIESMKNEQWAFKNDLGMYHFVSSWGTHVASWTKQNKDVPVVLIRYEDLLKDPEKEFSAILHALGFPTIDQERLEWAIEETSFGKLQKLEKERGFGEKSGHQEKFFRVGKAGQWKNTLSPDQVKSIEDDCWEIMEYCKYDRSTKLLKR